MTASNSIDLGQRGKNLLVIGGLAMLPNKGERGIDIYPHLEIPFDNVEGVKSRVSKMIDTLWDQYLKIYS